MLNFMIFNFMPSPVGPLLLAADEQGLRLVEFNSPRHPMRRGDDWREGDNDVLRETRTQLDDYFAGRRRTFALPLTPHGTDFQRGVWRTLATIPYGETISYAQLATRVGKPSAMRAVGAANGRNPLPIVLPCHRVIGSDGSLTGFGGGLPTKQFLLTLEGALPRDDLLFPTKCIGRVARVRPKAAPGAFAWFRSRVRCAYPGYGQADNLSIASR